MSAGSQLTGRVATTSCLILMLACARVHAVDPGSLLDPNTPYRGIAFLASDIGQSTHVGEMVDFVRTCRLNLVVIDFAWITYHWPRANMAAVREAAERLQANGVQVMVMYRPRLLSPEEAPVHYALDEDGAIARSHNTLCFAHEDSAAWGAQWGSRLRSAMPSIRQILLYNLVPSCRCPDCRDGGASRFTVKFLDRCRERWARPGPPVQIGHVGAGDEYITAVDFFCPFLCVNRTEENSDDFARTVARLLRLRADHKNTAMIPLLKVYWADETRNSSEDITRAIKACNAARTGFILWYYEWVFHSPDHRYDREAIIRAMKENKQGKRP